MTTSTTIQALLLEDLEATDRDTLCSTWSSLSDERESLHSLPISRSRSRSQSLSVSSATDFFGNSEMHNLFATRPTVDDLAVRFAALVESEPALLVQRNQFGRIPLHYALDGARVACEKTLRIYLSLAPSAVMIADNSGFTPYALSKKWTHSKAVRLALLEAQPQCDEKEFFKLKYGVVCGALLSWTRSLSSRAFYSSHFLTDEEFCTPREKIKRRVCTPRASVRVVPGDEESEERTLALSPATSLLSSLGAMM